MSNLITLKRETSLVISWIGNVKKNFLTVVRLESRGLYINLHAHNLWSFGLIYSLLYILHDSSTEKDTFRSLALPLCHGCGMGAGATGAK